MNHGVCNVRVRVCLALVAMAVGMPFVATSLADDWPQWRGPDRNGISQERLVITNWPPHELWRTNVYVGYSSVVVSEGRLYTVGVINTQPWVSCLDALTGTQVWRVSYAPSDSVGMVPQSTPTVYSNEVYTLGAYGELYCWDKRTGQQLWSKQIPAPHSGYSGASLWVDDTMIIANDGNGGVAIRRSAPHDILWSAGGGMPGYATPFVYVTNGVKVAVIFDGGQIKGVNATNGTTLWYHGWSAAGENIADPIIYGDKVFVTAKWCAPYCGLFRIGSGEMATVWTNFVLRSHMSSPIRRGDYVYGIHFSSSRLKCVDLRDGTEAWPYGNQYPVSEGNLIMTVDNRLILLGKTGKLSILRVSPSGYDASEGYTNFNINVPQYSDGACIGVPALANGRLYCRGYDGSVVCLELGTVGPYDRNENGIDDSWEQKHFGANGCVPDADADGDGMSNLNEYVAGTDPTNRLSVLAINGMSKVGPSFVLGFDTMSQRWYSVCWNTNLLGTNWTECAKFQSVTGGHATVSFDKTVPEAFLRIEVKQ